MGDSNGATPKDRLSEQGKNYQEILDLLRECHFVLEKHIIHAIESGDKSTIEKWLQEEETTKVNKYRGGSDYPGRHAVSNGTALHWAVYYKQLEIAQLLIDQGADPHERAKGGATVLHWACKSNKSDEELLQFVLNIHVKTKGAGPLVNVPDSRDLTPLHVACSDSNKELVELLLKAGANPAARDSFNATPKNRLSEGETYQDIVDLLDKYHSLPMKSNPGVQQHTFEESDSSDAQKKVLEQYIIDSIQRGNQSPINQWLEKDDTDVNECRGGNANYQSFAVANGTALHWAIYYGQLEIAQLLLRNGADPYQRAVGDETVLHWASQSKIRNEELLQLLFSVKTKSPGPLINVPDNGGLTPLHFACSSNNLKLVQLFMEAGAHPEARDHYHATPKDRLRDEYPNYQEIVDLLDKGYTSIRKGGSVHQERTTEGETAGLEVRAGSKSEQTEDEGKYKSSSTSTPSERETKV